MLKPFYCINTEKKRSINYDSDSDLIVARIPRSVERKIDKAWNDRDKLIEKACPPIIYYIMLAFVVVGFAVFAIFIMPSVSIVGFEPRIDLDVLSAFMENPKASIICAVCVVGFILLLLYRLYLRKKKENSDEVAVLQTHIDAAENMGLSSLGFSVDSPEIDVFSFSYVIRKGEIIVTNKDFKTEIYGTVEMKCYADDENFYITDYDVKYAFPFDCFKGVKKVNKKCQILARNKNKKTNDEFIQNCGMKLKRGFFLCSYFYVMEFQIGGNIRAIYIPPYEINTIENLLNITVEKQ